MLVPRLRLVVWMAVVVLPFAAIAGTVPSTLALCAALIGAALLTALADALLALSRGGGLRAELPGLVRLQKDRPGSFDVRIHNDSQQATTVRLGIAFPEEFSVPEEAPLTAVPGGTALSHLRWACTPRKRGRYLLERVYFEGISPLGLWARRTSQAAHCEVRVYPNLFAERKHVAALFLKRPNLGMHSQRQAGQGREFEKLRDYSPGDSVIEIHWKASAKRSQPVTKVFQVERTQEVYVIIDSSRLSARSVELADGSETTALERFVTAGLILGLAAEQKGDQFGLITFSDRVETFVRAKSGSAHYNACRDKLYTLQPRIVSPDFEELATTLRLRLRKRALLVFLTALDDPMLAESFVKSMDLLCGQHLILVNMLQPPGVRPLFNHPDVHQLEEVYRQLGGHWQWQKLRELEKVLRHRGVRFHLLDPSRLPAQLVDQHADVKARQLL